MKNKFFEKNSDYFYLVFRVIVGILFVLHGAMKWSAITSLSFSSLYFYAGIIELIGGALIILGLFTQTVASIAALEMLVAYFKVHAPTALSPLTNKGEPALLFFAAFLVLIVYGAGRISLDRIRSK